jgi:hypothetical protein
MVYSCYLTNLALIGERLRWRGKRRLINDTFSVNVDGIDLECRQASNFVSPDRAKVRGKGWTTTRLTIRGARSRAQAETVSVQLAWLLSLFSSNKVRSGFVVEGLVPVLRNARIGPDTFDVFRPAIDLNDSAELREGLQTAWPGYSFLHKSSKIDVAIDYYVLSQRRDPIEVLLALTFVLLEHLKHEHAASNPAGKIAPTKGRRKRRPSFEQLVRQMLRGVGMSLQGVHEVGQLRNEILHQGISSLPFAEQWKLYELGQDMAREFILRQIGFRGRFAPFSRPNGMQVIQ